jgi:hypothetical protein
MFGSTIATVVAAILSLLLIIITVIPWTIILRQTEYYKNDWPLRYDRALVSDIYPELRTGDIVLYAPQATILSPFTKSMFTHASLVLRERGEHSSDGLDDAISIVETSLGTPPGVVAPEFSIPTGVAITPFLSKIKYYPGPAYIMRLRTPLSAAQESAIIETAYRMQGDPYPSLSQGMFDAICGRPTPHCYQLVATLLHAGGLETAAGPSLREHSAITVCDAVRGLSDGKNYLVSGNGTIFQYGPLTEIMYNL